MNNTTQNPLKNRFLYVPEMDYGASRVFAAALRAEGLNARVVPPSSEKTLKKAAACTSGDECFPTQVTLGDVLHLLDEKTHSPEEVALFMPTAEGPCRFGQYATLARKVFDAKGYEETMVLSPTSENGYADLTGNSGRLQRSAWRGIIVGDILRKLLHTTRPYELRYGDTDAIYQKWVSRLCKIFEEHGLEGRRQLKKIHSSLIECRYDFKRINTHKKGTRPLIGIVGEIFCRLNTFSNNDLVRKLEDHGAECWLSGITEWILYTNSEQKRKLREAGRTRSTKMLATIIKDRVMKSDMKTLYSPFKELFFGREDVIDVDTFLRHSDAYLPQHGALGEMTLNAAGTVHFYEAGCAGVIDISPFTCMNGIISEAVYPKISRDHNNIPIRVFYFDGTCTNLDRDIGIFLELAQNYRDRMKQRD